MQQDHKYQELEDRVSRLEKKVFMEALPKSRANSNDFWTSEEKYRSVIDSIGVGVAVISPDMRILTLNREMRNMFKNIDSSGKPICYQVLNDPPREAPCDYCPTVKTMNDQMVHETTIDKLVDNQMRHYRIVATPVKDETGNIIAAIEMVEDVTIRWSSENRLERMNLLKEDLLGAGSLKEKLKRITDGICAIFDADFCRIWIIKPGDKCEAGCFHAKNTEGSHVCRYKDRCLHLMASSGRYTHIDSAVHGRVPFGCYKIGLVASNTEPKFITNDVTRDSRVHNHAWAKGLNLVSFAGYRLLSAAGKPIGVIALFSKHTITPADDIKLESIASTTAQVIQMARAEESLRESEEKFRLITDSAHDAIIMTDSQAKVLLWNKAATKLFGYSKDEAMFLRLDNFILPSNDLTEYKKMLQEFVESEKTDMLEKAFEHTVCKKDGTQFPVEVSISRILFQGQFNFIGTIRDLTERKRMEVLQQAKVAAEAANLAKSEFLANMSHEIRTPMNAIIGLIQLVMKTELSEKQQDYLDKIQISTHTLLNIINDILDFSKIEAGKMDLSIMEFQLHDVLDSLNDMFAAKAADKGIEMVISVYEETPCALIGDPLRLGQILINLTSNAIKFTDKGLIHINVDLVGKHPQQAVLKFSIRDNGIGIAPEHLERLFSPFTQVDGSSTRAYGGTGLGLSISKQLVELMGGTIWAESESGQGSTFSFTARLGQQPPDREDRLLMPEDLKGLQIIVVDDNEASQASLKNMLKSFKIVPTVVDSGEKALSLLSSPQGETRFDLVCLDWQMTGASGLEVLKQIRAINYLAHIPIIFMTESSREEIIRQAKTKGADAILIKPVKQSLLFDTIMNVFGKDAEAIPEKNKKCNISKPFDFESAFIKKLSGARVLLAEDNKINQQVAREILTAAMLKVVIANNGAEAVAAIRQSSFDAVLMDVQMPVMDGIEAARQIREFAPGLPIIAMTAHAMKGDREKCLKAGMNDYVSKPIDSVALYATLSKWIDSQYSSQNFMVSQNLTAMTKPEVDSIEQHPAIDIKKGIQRLMGKQDLYFELLQDFKLDYGEAGGNICQAIMQNDFQTAGKLVHTLKSVAGNLAMPDLCSIITTLEEKLDKKTAIMNFDLENFQTVFKKVLEAITIIAQHLVTETVAEKGAGDCRDLAATIDRKELEQVIRTIYQLLKWHDLESKNYLPRLQNLLPLNDYSKQLKELENHLSRYNFSQGIDVIEKIADRLQISLIEALNETTGG